MSRTWWSRRTSAVGGVVWRNSPAGPVKVPTCRRWSWSRARGQVVVVSGVLALVSMMRARSSASQQSRTWARMRVLEPVVDRAQVQDLFHVPPAAFDLEAAACSSAR
jgi:hypothetical protein